jgi:hypothetical protein
VRRGGDVGGLDAAADGELGMGDVAPRAVSLAQVVLDLFVDGRHWIARFRSDVGGEFLFPRD